MDYHPMDRRILAPCKMDLDDKDVKEDYRKLRLVHEWIGQIGRLPDSVLYSLAMRHSKFPKDPALKEKPKVPKPEAKEAAV